MTQLLDWLTQYSPPIVLLIALGAAFLWVAKVILERSIASGFAAQSKRLEMALTRRSAFEEKVLLERFERINGFNEKLMRVMTNLNRMRSGQPVPQDITKHGEIVPLTEVFEELEVHRLMLGGEFYGLFLAQSQLALKVANERSAENLARHVEEWYRLQEEIRSAVEEAFGISRIRW